MRKVLICQVKDQRDLVPLFVGAHYRLFDQIVLIDHNSKMDLREISIEKVTVVRVEVRPYLQQVYPNFVIRSLRLQERFDFIFALDIDEFLLVEDERLTEILHRNCNSAYIKLYWRNGILESSADNDEIVAWRHLENSPTSKAAVNSGKIKIFNFLHGYHSVWYSMRYKMNPLIKGGRFENVPISHFRLGLGSDFMSKINHKSFPNGTFWSKITRSASDDYVESCKRVAQGCDDINDRFKVAAFYRNASDSTPRVVDERMFEKLDFTGALDRRVSDHVRTTLDRDSNSASETCYLSAALAPQELKLMELARRTKKYTAEMGGLLHYDQEMNLVSLTRE